MQKGLWRLKESGGMTSDGGDGDWHRKWTRKRRRREAAGVCVRSRKRLMAAA